MQNHKLRHLIEDHEKNIAEMSSWPWDKTARHIDLINQQLRWAYKQQNESGMDILEEYWQQVVSPLGVANSTLKWKNMYPFTVLMASNAVGVELW